MNGSKNKIVPRSDMVVPALLADSQLHPHTGHDPDGVTETENAAGEALATGNWNGSYAITDCIPPLELSRQVLSELQRWRPPAVSQQDDITLIVVDVL